MAVDSSALSRLVSTDAPYVHSNIMNFYNQVRGSDIDTRSKTNKELKKLEEQLNEVKNQLETATISFMGTNDWKQFSNQIFNAENTYRGIALKILRTREMRDSFIEATYDVSDIRNAFSDAIPDFLNQLSNDTYTRKQTTDSIASYLDKNVFFDKGRGKQREALIEIFGANLQTEIENIFKRSLKSNQGVINKRILHLLDLKLKDKKASKGTKNAFEYFEYRFYQELAKSEVTYSNRQAPDDYLEQVEKGFEQLIEYKNKSNITGQMGEKVLEIVVNLDSDSPVEFSFIGDKTENQLKETEYSQFLKSVNTYKSADRQSVTDLVLTNPKTGQKARVQAKNALEALLLNLNIKESDKHWDAVTAVQSEAIGYLDLLKRLKESSNSLNVNYDEITSLLSYIIANVSWANVSKERDMSEMNNIVQRQDALMSSFIQQFLGITITGALENSLQVEPTASNLFYSVSNAVLVPTYVLLEGIINNIKGMEHQIARISTTVDRSSLKWFYKTPYDLYTTKMLAVAPNYLSLDENYQDQDLLRVGRTQGSAIKDLKLSRVNLKIDVHTLVTSTYNFESIS